MAKSRYYLKKHANGRWYIHWTEDRIGKRISTKCRDHAAAKAFAHRRFGERAVKPGGQGNNERQSGRIYADSLTEEDLDPLKRLLASRTALSLLMLRYENLVLIDNKSLNVRALRIQILMARAKLSYDLSFYQDSMAIAAGQPLAPPDCDSVLWPRRPRG